MGKYNVSEKRNSNKVDAKVDRKDLSGNYYSTNDFVGTHKLQEQAENIFGKGWEAEDDVAQIESLIKSLGGGYVVSIPEDRSQWNGMREMYDLANPTNDSNYDIFVISESDFKYADGGGVGESSFFDIYDEESGKTLLIKAYSLEQAEGISETIDFNDYEDGEEIDVLDDIANYESGEYSKGGGVPRNVGRDWLFKSKQDWEQKYDRKREYKEYKKEGWLANWFKDGGEVGNIPKNATVHLIIDNSGSIVAFSTKDGKPLIEKFDEIESEFKNRFSKKKLMIHKEERGGGGFDLDGYIELIKAIDERNEIENSYVIILTDGNEYFDIDFPKNTIIITTEEGKRQIEKHFPNVSAIVLSLDDNGYEVIYSEGYGERVGKVDWNNFSMQDVLNEYKNLRIWQGEYKGNQRRLYLSDTSAEVYVETKFTLENFQMGVFSMGELVKITLHARPLNNYDRFNVMFVANTDFVKIKPNQQGDALLDIKRMASDIVEQFPNYGGYDKEILADGGRVVSNSSARSMVANKSPFRASNLSGRNFGNVYVVESYGYYPLFVYKNGVWYENANKFSASTSKQMSQSRPNAETILSSTKELEGMYKFADGGLAWRGNENAEMVINNNNQIKHHTEELEKIVTPETEVPAWVVSKVNRSASDLSDATHYLDGVSKYEDGGMETSKISTATLEAMVGRKLDGWNDDVVYFNGAKYQKCYLQPFYKLK